MLPTFPFRLGLYEVKGSLGRSSGSQEVLYADTAAGLSFVLKLAREDSDSAARLRREASFLQRVGHPALISLADSGEVTLGGTKMYWIAVPRLIGKDMGQMALLARPSGIAPEAAVVLVAPLLEALQALHNVGILHRDFKPENAFLCDNGQMVLLDLGLAFDSNLVGLSEHGTRNGTPGYMAPEQVQGHAVGPWTDLFSIGVCLYELLVGRRPFERGSMSEEINATLHGEFQGLLEVAPRVEPKLAQAVERCLHASPEQRWRSATELRHALVDCLPQEMQTNEAQQQLRHELATGALEALDKVTALRLKELLQTAETETSPFRAVEAIGRALAYVPDSREAQNLAEGLHARVANNIARAGRRRMLKKALTIALTLSAIISIAWRIAPGAFKKPSSSRIHSGIAQADLGVAGFSLAPTDSWPAQVRANPSQDQLKRLRAIQGKLAKKPSSLALLAERGALHARVGQLRDAHDDLVAALDADAHNISAWRELADLYSRIGRAADAQRLLEHAVALAPQDPNTLERLVELKGASREAWSVLQRGRTHGVRSPRLDAAACSLSLRHDRTQAESLCAEATRTNKDAFVQADYATALRLAQKYADARTAILRALKSDPTRARWWYEKALDERGLGHSELEIEAAQRACALGLRDQACVRADAAVTVSR